MMRRAFIATQAPIPDAIPDFWRMIWEQKSSTIVILSKETESRKVLGEMLKKIGRKK